MRHGGAALFVLLLANPPSSRYAVHSATSVAKKAPPARAFLAMGGYVVIIGIGAFLEKAALRELDATQLNGLMAIAMTAVALVAFAVEGPRMPCHCKPWEDWAWERWSEWRQCLISWVCAACRCLSPLRHPTHTLSSQSCSLVSCCTSQ